MDKIKFYLNKKNWIINEELEIEMSEMFCDLKEDGGSGYEEIMKGNCSDELKELVEKYGDRVFEEFVIKCLICDFDSNVKDIIVCM